MLNNIYSTPLHGVECFVGSGKQNKTTLPYSVNVYEEKITLANNAQPIWSLVDEGKRYATKLNIYNHASGGMVLDVKCEGKGRFLLNKNNIVIDWELGGTDSTHYFQTIAMAFWLELNSVPCIHANALEFNGETIAFIGPSGMGKSTLSAHLQKQGFKWLTDDMLAVHQSEAVYASWPKARMWPDSVEHVAKAQSDDLSKVHERFAKRELNLPAVDSLQPHKLSAIYLLNRQGAKLNNLELSVNLKADKTFKLARNNGNAYISDVKTSIGLIALLQNSMLGSAYSCLGLEKERLRQLSLLMANVPIRQINYKSDFSGLAEVQDLVIGAIRSK